MQTLKFYYAKKLSILLIFGIWNLNQVAGAHYSKIRRLGKYNVDPSSVTISGFSSGGAEAMQFHLAHSSKLLGVGIFSGVPYMYGYGRKREDFYVTEPDQFNVSFAFDMANHYEQQGLIDPLENLKKSRVYIYHGTKDSTVYHGSGKVIQKIYANYNCTMKTHLDTMAAEHGMPSDNYGGPCGTLNLIHYLVNNCEYNGVFEMFNHLYGENLVKPEGSIGTVPLKGEFFEFNQAEFFRNRGYSLSKISPSMHNLAYAYIPSGCSTNETAKPCKLSFALHGCEQTRETYQDKFPKTTGYLEMAELNDIIVIFPQTKRSYYNPRNPSACWDWMGFTGNEYGTKNGLQTMAIKKMMDRILGEDA